MDSLTGTLGVVVDNARNELVDYLVLAIKDEVKKLVDITKVVKQVDISDLVRQAIYDHFRQHVENEIGNRLRCGIYDGTKVDKLFESVWTSELDKAIKERIGSKVNKAIDGVIAERLKNI